MISNIGTPRAASRTLAITVVFALAACGGKGGAGTAAAKSADAAPSSGTRIVACTLMPKEEINAITGGSYTTTESTDDGHSSDTGCQYATATDPAGVTFNVSWISPRDYSDPVEHAALQKAMIGGARLGGKLVSQSIGGASIPGLPTGPVDGVGDEATQSMLLLTARKGDYSVMVQMYPGNMMKLMTDSTFAIALFEKEKTIARQALAKL